MSSVLRGVREARHREPLSAADAARALPIDHVVFAESEAALGLALLDRAPARGGRPALVLMTSDRHPLPRFERADTLARIESRALALGFRVARAGAGRADAVYLEHGAIPGHTAVCAGAALWRAGALAVLTLPVDTLEAAACVMGARLEPGVNEERSVVLDGRPMAGVSGWDVGWTIAERVGSAGLGRGAIAVCGPGADELAMRDRLQLCAVAGAATGRALVFPSDETTRAWLRARRRESDWRAVGQGDEPEGAWHLELERVEPMLRAASGGAQRRYSDFATQPVDHVLIGPDVTLDDLLWVAGRLAGRRVHRRVRVIISAGCAAMHAALDAAGVWQAMVDAGCEVAVTTESLAPGEAHTLEFGRGLDEAGVWRASLEACVLAAVRGEVCDPREVGELTVASALAESRGTDSSWVVGAEPDLEAASGLTADATDASSRGEARGTLRGPLLYKGGDGVEPAALLPWGARLEPDEGDVAAFARHALEPLDPDFAARAGAHAVGFIAAGRRMGVGAGAAERAALALAQVGVCGVLALSFDLAWRRRLVYAGVLPMRFERESDWTALERGDELELPAHLDSLETQRPFVVRNLTRGFQCIVHHDLDERDLGVLRAGGLLNYARTLLTDAASRRMA